VVDRTRAWYVHNRAHDTQVGMLIVGLSQAIFVPSAAQLHLSFSSPHSERLVGSFSLSHFDRRTELPERLSMPLLILPSHVASPIARAVQIGLPVRAPVAGAATL
jgi:hypothetical protein